MRIVALEEHLLPGDLASTAFPDGAPPGIGPALDDVGEGRLAVMDAAGIDVQVLSLVGYGVQQLPASDAVPVARDANDRTAAAVAAHPDRFAAFAVLPLTAPAEAADELVRARRELGFVGAMLHGTTDGRFLDDPAAEPVLSAAEELGVPLYLHPAPPPQPVRDAYFGGLGPAVGAALATAGWGWHAECGLHVLRMAVAGVFDRHPGLRLLVGHMGENLPFSLARADQRLTPVATHLQRGVAETVLDHVVLTTSGYVTDPPLRCALDVFGPERVLFSVDHPFSESREAVDFLAAAPVDDAVREAIAHGNAERLLGV